MSDLVERLREAADSNTYQPVGVLWNLCDEASDEIERLREIVSSLPHTADGKPVTLGSTLWCIDDEDGWEGEITVRGMETSRGFGTSAVEWLLQTDMSGEVFASDCWSSLDAAKSSQDSEAEGE